MIKKSLGILFALLVISQFLQAQDSLLYGIFPMYDGRIVYQKIISVDSESKDELFRKGRDWAAKFYKVETDTSQIENKVEGLLVYKGFVTVLFDEPGRRIAAEWRCMQIVKILCEDNKATISITDLEQKAPSGYGTLTAVKIEGLKSKTDSLPKSVFFGKNSREKYWKSSIVTLKEIDTKMKALIASLEKSLKL